jgi:hypothetical protein
LTISEHNRAKASTREIPKNGHLLLATLKNSPRKHQAERRCGTLIEKSVYGIPDNLYLPTTYQGENIPPYRISINPKFYGKFDRI